MTDAGEPQRVLEDADASQIQREDTSSEKGAEALESAGGLEVRKEGEVDDNRVPAQNGLVGDKNTVVSPTALEKASPSEATENANTASDELVEGENARRNGGEERGKQPSMPPDPHAVNGHEDVEGEATAKRATSDRTDGTQDPVRAKVDKQTSDEGKSDQAGTSTLQPESLQHRHSADKDKPSSYQPGTPSKFFHMKALALQLPSHSSSNQQSSSHHIDPPTLILEGRTNLSTARRSFYPRVTRTLPELQLWILTLTLSFPAGIFSPFNYPSPSLASGGSMEDAGIRSYLATVSNQLARILRKPYVLSHPATVALVDCDFSYNPGMPHVGPGSSATARRKLEDGVSLARMGHDPLRGRKGKTGTGPSATATWDVDGVAAALGLPSLPSQASNDTYGPQHASPSSKGPLSLFSRANASPQRIQPMPSVPIPPGEEDQDEEELTAARNEITRLELQFEKASRAAQFLVERSGAMTATLHQLSSAMTDLARLDEGRSVARKARQSEDVSILTKGIESWSAAQAGANAALLSTVVPSMTYQSFNARAAIDALLRRAAAATHRHSALVVLVQKRREAERLKRARGEIRQEDVDWVLQELRDAQRTTQVLTHHLTTFTQTLKDELKEHSRNTHTDIQTSLLHHARSSIRAQRFMLNNLIRARDGLVALREGRPTEKVDVMRANEEQTHKPASSSGLDQTPAPTENDETRVSDLSANKELDKNEGGTPGGLAIPAVETDTPPKESSVDLKNHLPEAPSPSTIDQSAESEEQVGILEDTAEQGSQAEPVNNLESNDPALSSQAQEPSPWAASQEDASPLGWAESAATQNIAESSPWAQPSSAPLSAPTNDPSPWTVQSENATPPSVRTNERLSAFGTQSTFLPPRLTSGFGDDEDTENPFRSATANDVLSPPAQPSMSQSAFLPGRDMSRYANPFARMDGGASSNPFGAAPSGGNAGPGRIPRSALGPEAAKTDRDRSPPAFTAANTNDGAKGTPQNNPWANRSRISASDAARSLGGRF